MLPLHRNGNTADGIPPFTTPGDISTPNEAYFARVDDRVQLAAQYGLNLILDPAETIGTLQLLRNNGVTKNRAYGQYLGNRYRNFDNIIWMSGNDFQTWNDPDDRAVVQAVALGILDTDPRHIQTVELNYTTSDSLDDPSWAPIISLNAAYSYDPTYFQVLKAYNRSNFIPVFMVEANYEFGHNSGDLGTPDVLRKQEYWTMLSGGNVGQIYGNHHMSGSASFPSDWQSWLDTPGGTQMGYVRTFFQSRRWYDLVPDQTHVVVTAVSGGFGCTGSGTIAANGCTTAARTSDGTLALAYVPRSATLTVNMAQLSGQVTARWFDPTNNTYRAITGSPFPNTGSKDFAHPGNNGDGFADWVLALEAAAAPTPTPGAISLTGTISYCASSTTAPARNVALNLTGSQVANTTTDSSGNYAFSSLAAGGNYTVIPNKTRWAPGNSGAAITTADVLAVERHYLNISVLSGCRLTAGDVNGDNVINTVDVIAIQHFFLGNSSGIANTGSYQFTPAQRSYTQLNVNQSGQNYDAIVFGDVTAPFAQ